MFVAGMAPSAHKLFLYKVANHKDGQLPSEAAKEMFDMSVRSWRQLRWYLPDQREGETNERQEAEVDTQAPLSIRHVGRENGRGEERKCYNRVVIQTSKSWINLKQLYDYHLYAASLTMGVLSSATPAKVSTSFQVK